MSTNQLLEHIYNELSNKLKCKADIETSSLLYTLIRESLETQDNAIFDIESNDMSNDFLENVQPIYLTPPPIKYTHDCHRVAEHSGFLLLKKDDPIFTPTPRLEMCDAKLEKMCRNQRGRYIDDDDDVVAPINFELLKKATAPDLNKPFV